MLQERERKIYKVTLLGTLVNAILVLIKFIAGFVGHSSAMVADAVHSLTDFVTDAIVLIFVKISSKPRDRTHDYGHGKFETFATMVIGFILALAGIGLLINGIQLLIHAAKGLELPRPTMIAFIVAILSILFKEALYHYTIRVGRQVNSSAVIANAWHHRSDAISSVGTLIGISGAMFLGARWRILDPLAAVVVSFFIIKSGYDIMHPSVNELLESSLGDDTEREIAATIVSVTGVRGMHNLRTRRIGNSIAIDVHVKMEGDMSLSEAHTIASEIERRIRKLYGENSQINIHMEPAP